MSEPFASGTGLAAGTRAEHHWPLPRPTFPTGRVLLKVDVRFVGKRLTKGTYLTSVTDGALATTGFGVVGRCALPIPMSAHFRFEYEIRAGRTVDVGTVAPNFGQSGGGVEVRLQNPERAKLIGKQKLPQY